MMFVAFPDLSEGELVALYHRVAQLPTDPDYCEGLICDPTRMQPHGRVLS